MTLKIQFDGYTTDSQQVKVPVDVVDPARRWYWRDVMSIGQVYPVSVPNPGLYLVRIWLPNGELVEDQVHVRSSDTEILVRLRPALHSPHEHFGWAFYLRSGPRTTLQRGLEQRAIAIARANELNLADESAEHPPRMVAKLFSQQGGVEAINVEAATIGMGQATQLLLPSSSLPRWMEVSWEIAGKLQKQYVCVPPNDEVESAVMLTSSPGANPDVTVRYALPEAESLLSFLVAGDLPSARRIAPALLDRVPRFLDSKTNPMSCIIAAIYMLRVGNIEILGDWPRLLAEVFGPISDARVVAGWYSLRVSQEPDINRAATYFLDAFTTGVPALSLSLYMLNDGLNFLRSRYADERGLTQVSDEVRRLVSELVPERKSVTTLQESGARWVRAMRPLRAIRSGQPKAYGVVDARWPDAGAIELTSIRDQSRDSSTETSPEVTGKRRPVRKPGLRQETGIHRISRTPKMSQPELVRALVDAGVHFGHRVSRWNPKMAPYIHGKRNQIHVIDVRETLKGLLRARKLVQSIIASGKDVLFVGSKRQARHTIEEEAKRCGMHYVSERWLGGTLTNFRTIRSRLARMEELEKLFETGQIETYSKKMKSTLKRELDKMKTNLDGIRKMDKMPGVMFLIDVRREHIAVKEAKKMGVPTIAIVDTDCDPDPIDLPIPGNDDAMRAIELIVKELADAAIEGKQGRTDKSSEEGGPRRLAARAAFRAEGSEKAKELPAVENPAVGMRDERTEAPPKRPQEA